MTMLVSPSLMVSTLIKLASAIALPGSNESDNSRHRARGIVCNERNRRNSINSINGIAIDKLMFRHVITRGQVGSCFVCGHQNETVIDHRWQEISIRSGRFPMPILHVDCNAWSMLIP